MAQQQSIEDMIRNAAGATPAAGAAGAAGASGTPAGVTIERQSVEHVRGQAKSGN
jgi:ribosomal protein L12E/L44/L45/RPP1/RPP2